MLDCSSHTNLSMEEELFQGEEDDRYEVTIVNGDSTYEYILCNKCGILCIPFIIVISLSCFLVSFKVISPSYFHCYLLVVFYRASW